MDLFIQEFLLCIQHSSACFREDNTDVSMHLVNFARDAEGGKKKVLRILTLKPKTVSPPRCVCTVRAVFCVPYVAVQVISGLCY